MHVRSHPGVTGTKLARLLGVTHQNVSALVARLTGRGWLDRRTQAQHPQVLELHLTGHGLATLNEADRLVASLEARLITALGDDDAAALSTALNQLRDLAQTDRHPETAWTTHGRRPAAISLNQVAAVPHECPWCTAIVCPRRRVRFPGRGSLCSLGHHIFPRSNQIRQYVGRRGSAPTAPGLFPRRGAAPSTHRRWCARCPRVQRCAGRGGTGRVRPGVPPDGRG